MAIAVEELLDFAVELHVRELEGLDCAAVVRAVEVCADDKEGIIGGESLTYPCGIQVKGSEFLAFECVEVNLNLGHMCSFLLMFV